ncbi:adenosylhomocysteinase [Frondihabitans australicus]|uniref:adenosylhomocysteinase n=1 Tax=Frondihabitans australicus TaxID=386892 RepID=UPI001FE835D3|nr:adenosylhomocysteinase [Frondihabitans australicus]
MSAIETVRRFARATNLGVAGRRFRVAGDGADAEAVRRILLALGGVEVEPGERADTLWCTRSASRDELAAVAGVTPLVVVDAGAASPALDLDALGARTPARPGVLAVDGLPGVFVVPQAEESDEIDGDPTTRSHSVADARARIAWARRFMPVSARLAEWPDGPGLYGLRIALSMVLEPKTAVLALLLRDAGAVVDVYAHADETDDAVADALRDEGFDVFASSTATPLESRDLALSMLDRRPDLLIDDGSHVIRLAHELRPAVLDTMIGAAEETTSGLRPLRVMAARDELRLPVVAVNDALTKTFFDNRYGTGQSCVFAILDLAAMGPKRVRKRVAAGRTAVVAGFGPVGEGVAQALRASGLRVVVSEIDPVRALQASYAGYPVRPLLEAVTQADVVISATGVRDTISPDVLGACSDGALVAVAGGVDGEVAIDEAQAAGAATDLLAPNLDALALPDGPTVVVLGGAGCINITAGEGNPIEIMDLSFAGQLAAIRTLLDGAGRLDAGVHPVGAGWDARIADEALRAAGLSVGDDGDDDPGVVASAPAPALLDTRTTRFDDRTLA